MLLVEGTYEDAFHTCQESVTEFGWYNRNCAINPYLVEGKKTCGLEIAEQMRGRLPDVVTVALGDGCTTAGIWKGLTEMKGHGVIDRLPRILAVQAEGAAPLAKTFERGGQDRAGRREDRRRLDQRRRAAKRCEGSSGGAGLRRGDRHGGGRGDPVVDPAAGARDRASSRSRRASPRWPASRPPSPAASSRGVRAFSTSRPATA